MGNCPSGTVFQSGACRVPCNVNFVPSSSDPEVCTTDCGNMQTNEGGTRCIKNVSPAPCGVPPSVCPSSHPALVAFKCFKACPAGYQTVSLSNPEICGAVCPEDFATDGLNCIKPADFLRGPGFATQSECTRSELGRQQRGCSQCRSLWYPNCPAFMTPNENCESCQAMCPIGAGWIDSGDACIRPTSDRGPGINPIDCDTDHPVRFGDLCYQRCPNGMTNHVNSDGTCSCISVCPPNSTNLENECVRDTYIRGSGAAIQGASEWFSDWWWLLLLLLIVILAIVIFGLYTWWSGRRSAAIVRRVRTAPMPPQRISEAITKRETTVVPTKRSLAPTPRATVTTTAPATIITETPTRVIASAPTKVVTEAPVRVSTIEGPVPTPAPLERGTPFPRGVPRRVTFAEAPAGASVPTASRIPPTPRNIPAGTPMPPSILRGTENI